MLRLLLPIVLLLLFPRSMLNGCGVASINFSNLGQRQHFIDSVIDMCNFGGWKMLAAKDTPSFQRRSLSLKGSDTVAGQFSVHFLAFNSIQATIKS